MATILRQRRDTASNWTSANPVIPDGQLCFDTTNDTFRIGDGTTAYGSLPIQSGAAGDVSVSVANTFSANQTFTEFTETVYALTGTALDPANGGVQTLALSSGRTLTDSLTTGQSIILMITGAVANVLVFPTITWVTSSGNVAPTLTASSPVVVWKVGSTLYGAVVGSYV